MRRRLVFLLAVLLPLTCAGPAWAGGRMPVYGIVGVFGLAIIFVVVLTIVAYQAGVSGLVLLLITLACVLLALAGAAAAGEVIFCNMAPGQYLGTCDGVPIECNVGADGTLSAECQSVSFVRMASGVSFSCEAVDE